MEEKGVMYGIIGSYAYHNNFMLKTECKSSWGLVDYEGSIQSTGASYTVDSINNFMLESRWLVGYDFYLTATDSSYASFTPYIGFGYRYLLDNLDKDVRGYDRESNYFYSPIGVEVLTKIEDGWSVGGMVEYDLFWYGLQRTHWEDYDPAYSTMDNDQHGGWGIRGSIKIQKEWKDIGLIIEPFIKYWSIDASDLGSYVYSGSIVDVGWEPENNSIEIGGKIAVTF